MAEANGSWKYVVNDAEENETERPTESRAQSRHDVQYDRGPKPSEVREMWVVREPRRNTHWPAIILIIFGVIAAIVVALWMQGMHAQLSSVQNAVHQNSQSLARQQHQLNAIQATLQKIQLTLQQLTQSFHQMQSEMQQFFTAILQAIH